MKTKEAETLCDQKMAVWTLHANTAVFSEYQHGKNATLKSLFLHTETLHPSFDVTFDFGLFELFKQT